MQIDWYRIAGFSRSPISRLRYIYPLFVSILHKNQLEDRNFRLQLQGLRFQWWDKMWENHKFWTDWKISFRYVSLCATQRSCQGDKRIQRRYETMAAAGGRVSDVCDAN